MRRSTYMFAGLMLFASAAQAETGEGYPANTTIKGYAKRDRLLVGGIYDVSPTQLHEVSGLRADLGTEYNLSAIRSGNGTREDINNPSLTVRGEYGWDQLTLGLGVSYLDGVNASNKNVDESFISRKGIPQIAYTIGKYATVAAGIELISMDVTEKAERETSFSYNLQRPVVGAAYHTEYLEFGVAYNSEAQDSTTVSRARGEETILTLSQSPDNNTRAVYLPAETVVYGRGNFTDAWSVLSSVSMSRYDGNVEGAVDVFDRYRTEDRMAAKVTGTYATPSRSSVSLTAEYKGGATTAIGADEAGLGYRLANTYGGSVAGVYSMGRKTYFGLMAGIARGERDSSNNDGVRYSARESTTRIAGSVTLKL